MTCDPIKIKEVDFVLSDISVEPNQYYGLVHGWFSTKDR